MNSGLRIIGGLGMAAMLLFAAPLVAAPDAGTIALSPEQREAALEAAAVRPSDDLGGPQNRQVHGEMGIEIGTRGTRALYGTAVTPLGDTGTLALSFLTARQNGYRHR